MEYFRQAFGGASSHSEGTKEDGKLIVEYCASRFAIHLWWSGESCFRTEEDGKLTEPRDNTGQPVSEMVYRPRSEIWNVRS
jgi:hypothetical protein